MKAILEYPDFRIELKGGKTESRVIKMIRRVRPDWPREDIILHRLPPAPGPDELFVFAGYTYNKTEAVIVRVYSKEHKDMVSTLIRLRSIRKILLKHRMMN